MTTDFAALLKGGKCLECGTRIEHFGVCDSCAERNDQNRLNDFRREALSTIHRSYRWATFESRLFGDRVAPQGEVLAHKVLPALRTRSVPMVVIHGPAGSGKTALACAMMRKLIDDGSRVGVWSRFQCALELSYVASESKLGSTPYEVGACLRSSLLVLDDLGQEEPSNRGAARRVIHGRFGRGKPTIVTTYMDPARLVEVYGEGASRRLTELSVLIPMGAGKC